MNAIEVDAPPSSSVAWDLCMRMANLGGWRGCGKADRRVGDYRSV